MKKHLLLLLSVVTLLLVLPGSLSASHLIGGNLGYEYLGPSATPGLYTYRVLLTTYVNCDSTSAVPFPPAQETVGIYDQDIPNNPMGGGNKPFEALITVNLFDTTLIIPPGASTCAVGQGTCIIEGLYEGTIDVPINFNGYHLYWYDCCRNFAIDNLQGPGGTGFAFQAYIPPTLVNNSTPVFGDVPVPFICVGDTTSILNTAFDPDGDLLVFSFVEPMSGASQGNPQIGTPLGWTIDPVNYNLGGGYSLAAPFGPGGGAFIDGATGLTQYYIPNPGEYVVAVEIREFRNGNLIGVSRRDLQILAINCPPNDPPNIASTNNGITQFTVEEGDLLCFDIDYADLNGDSLTLTANGNIFDPLLTNPAATITTPVDGDSTVGTTFCWQTACGQAQAAPYLFTVSIQDDGCPPKTANEVYEITVTPAVAPTQITGPTIVCEGEVATYTTDNIPGSTYNWTVSNGTINSGQGTTSIDVTWGSAGPGMVSVSAISALGCPTTQIDLNITILAAPTADAGPDTTVCLGDSVQIGGSPTGGAGATFSWSPTTGLSDPNAANPMASPAVTTTYIVTVDEGLNCVGTDTVVVTVGNPTMDAGADTDICIGDSTQLNASGGVTYSWTPTTDLSDPNIADPWASPTTTTTYTVDIVDALGCAGQDSVIITVNPLPIADAGPDTAICDGTPVQIGGSPTGPAGSTYSWTPAGTLDDASLANPTASPLVQTTYIVEVTDANGCVNTDTVVVSISTPPPADAGNDTTICEGDCAQLIATGGVGYSWSPTTGLSDPNISNPQACPTVTTTYTVTVSDAAGCTATDDVTVTVNSLPAADAGPDIPVCIAGTVTIGGAPTGPAGSTYAWTPAGTLNDPTLANPDATPAVTTTYTVTVTDANGCVNTDDMTVTVNPLPTVDAGNDTTICDGASVQIGGAPTGPAGSTYAWVPGGTLDDPSIANPTATPTVSPTTYTVTVTDGNGCVNTDDITVTLSPAPTADAGNDTTICDGDCAQLNASGGVTYSWSPTTGLSDPNIANPLACATATTTYTVTVTDAQGCTDTDDVTVTVNPLPTVDAGPDLPLCDGGTVTIGGAPTGAAGSTYAWTPAGTLNDPTVANPDANPTTTTTYTVTVTDANGCVNTDDMTVNVNTLPTVDAGPDTTICDAASVQIGGTPTGPAGSTFAWTPAGTLDDPALANPTATPTVSPTTYTVTVTDSNGCVGTDDVTVTLSPPPVADAGNDTTICDGDCAQLGATGGVTYSWTPTTGLSDPNIANPQACPAATTTYTVTVTDANGCTDTDDVTVTISPLPTADAGLDTAICIGETVTIGGAPTGPAGSTFAWTPAGTLNDGTLANPDATPAVTTTYTVTVTDALGCVNTDDMTVTINPLPTVDAGPDTTICDGTSVQVGGAPTGPAGSTYAWTPAGTLDDPALANPTATPTVSPTTYTVTVTDANGCVNADDMTVTLSPLPTADAGNDTTICDGDCAQLNATGGVTYSWSPTAGLSDPNIANPLACATTTTTYTVTVTDANGCVDTDDVIVTVNPLPTVEAGNDTAICIGATVTIGGAPTGPAGSTYTWTPAGTLNDPSLANPDATPAVTTTYYVTVTDANGCSDMDSISVTINPLPIVDAGPDTTICDQGSVQIGGAPTGPAGSIYAWTPAGTLDDPALANPTATPTVSPTTYTVTVTDANGCVDTDDMTVTLTPLPTADAGPDTAICITDSVQLTATGGVTYSWSPTTGLSDPNIANPMASPAATTTYTVTVTDASGCVDTDDVTVTVNPLPTITISNDTAICINDSVQLSASGGTSYVWTPAGDLSDPNISNPWASPAVTTTFYVTVTDGNGCSNIDSVLVTVNPLPIADAGPDTTICDGTPVQIGGNPTGPAGSTFSWNPNATLDDGSIANPTASPVGNTTYVVTVTDLNGCVNTDVVDVTVSTLPPADAGLDTAICAGDSVQLTATGGTVYSWSPTTGLSDPNIADPMASPATTTTYTVTVTDAQGCSATDDVDVTVNPLPAVDAGPDSTICIGTTITIGGSPTGPAGSTYAWTPAGTLNDPTLANPDATTPVTTTYYVTVTDPNGCSNIDSMTITVNPLPIVSAGPDTAICLGDSTQLQATGGVTYSWGPSSALSDPNIADPFASPISTITYTVTVTDANGCVNTDDVTVTVNALPVVDAGNDTTICFSDSAQLIATGGTTYAWTPITGLSDPNIANPLASPLDTTTYVVNVIDGNGCPGVDSVTVNVLPLPTPNAGMDAWLCPGDSIQLTGSGGGTYSWSPGATLSDPNIANPMAGPTDTTNYILTVTDAAGCSNTDTVTIIVNDDVPTDAGNDTTICVGDTIVLGGNPTSVNGTTFTWTPAASLDDPTFANPSAFPAFTTTYYLTTTNDTCTAVDSVTVIVNQLPTIDAGPDLQVCAGDSVPLLATGGVSYVWTPIAGLSDPNIADPMASPVDTIMYYVTGTDANGCSNIDSVEVTVNPLPIPDAGPDVQICFGDSAQLAATGGATYSWSPTTGLSDPNIANPMASPADTTVYYVTVTDTNSCSAVDSTTVTVNPPPVVDAGADVQICIGDSTQLVAAGGVTYSWTPTTGLSDPNIANPMAGPSDTTMYYVTVVDSNSCVNIDSVLVTVNPLPLADAGIDVQICIGDSTQLAATGGDTYIWLPATGLDDPNSPNPWASPSDTTTYVVLVVDSNNCANTDTVIVTVNPLPIANAGPDINLCLGDTAQLNATGGATYVWTPPFNMDNQNISDPNVWPDVTTTYSVTVTDTNGCVAVDSMIVDVFRITVSPDTSLCEGDSVQLSATGPGAVSFSWSPTTGLSDPNIANPLASPSVTTIYTVTVTDGNGCTDQGTVTVTVNVNPTADFTVEYTPDCDGIRASFTNLSTNAHSYVWDFGDGEFSSETDPEHIYSYGSTFTAILTAISSSGCTDTATLSNDIQAFEEYFTINVPNVFTPNNDGVNDRFELNVNGTLGDCIDFRIFNRWGQLMFLSTGNNTTWDGRTSTGVQVPAGTYFYVLTIKGMEYKGSITVLH